MALVESVLQAGFAAAPEQTDATAAAQQFAGIYLSYALSAQAGVFLPILTGLEVTRLQAVLAAQFSNHNGTPVQAAQAFVDGLTQFWLTPPVPFGTNPPPVPLAVVVAFAGAPALLAALQALFAAPNDTNTFAAGLAAALDVATRTVVVQLAAPPFTQFNLS